MNALSYTSGYAIVALSFVGAAGGRLVQTYEIAQATGIPKPYLAKILHALGKAGLIQTKRGKGGGVLLSRPADAMTLLDVAGAVEPDSALPRCFMGMATCSDEKPCPMHVFWKETRERIRELLARTTLADVASFQADAGYKAAPVEELLPDLAAARQLQRTKPTSRFRRKFDLPQR